MGKGTVRFVTLYVIEDTFTTKACGETFKIQSGILNCNSHEVVYLLKCRICGEGFHAGKAKTKFRARFDNYKSAHRSYRKKRKVSQQRFHEHYGQHSHNGIDDRQFTLIEQCEKREQLKEREIFWQHRLKTFYPYGLNGKKEYLYCFYEAYNFLIILIFTFVFVSCFNFFSSFSFFFFIFYLYYLFIHHCYLMPTY